MAPHAQGVTRKAYDARHAQRTAPDPYAAGPRGLAERGPCSAPRRRAGQSRLAGRAGRDRARPDFLGRRAAAHEGTLAHLLAQSGQLRRGHRHHLAASRGLHCRPDPVADAASHSRRPARQLRLRRRDDPAHADHRAGQSGCRHTGAHHRRRHLAGVREGMHSRRGAPVADVAGRSVRFRARHQGRHRHTLRIRARHAAANLAVARTHGGRARHADPARSGQGPEARSRPLRPVLPVLRDAHPPRRAADAHRNRHRPQPASAAQRTHHRHAQGCSRRPCHRGGDRHRHRPPRLRVRRRRHCRRHTHGLARHHPAGCPVRPAGRRSSSI